MFGLRTWSELLYAMTDLPVVGAATLSMLLALALGLTLSVTGVGLALFAAGLALAREIGGLERARARRLLGLHLDPPAWPRPAPGFLRWVGSTLADGVAWRAALYLLLRLPLAFMTWVLAAGLWAVGLADLTYPAWSHLYPQSWAGMTMDTPPRVLEVTAAGALALLAAPWVVRGAVRLSRALVGFLLGPTALSERVRTLEERRGRAVEDSEAALRRIERDLHDGPQARLTTLAMDIGRAREALAEGADPSGLLDQLLEISHQNAREALVELRNLARGIHPPILDSGLAAALETLATQSALPVDLDVSDADRPSPAIETILYFCAAELLANALKHSGGRRVRISLSGDDTSLLLRVEDDGVGGATMAGGGLCGLEDRVRTVDGRVAIRSPRGGPTVVTIEVPRHA